MTTRRRNWILGIGLAAVVAVSGLAIAVSQLAAHAEPYARQAAIHYLEQRFDSDVQLQSLHLEFPKTSLWRLMLTRGRGISAHVEGQGLSLRLKSRTGSAPLFAIRKFSCEVSLDSLLHPPAMVSQVSVEGMDIQVPPRRTGPRLPPSSGAAQPQGQGPAGASVMIAKVSIRAARLVLQPQNPQRTPLEFDIHTLQLESAEPSAPMKYSAALTNAKPPGEIQVSGMFGPWRASEPGDTLITGDYVFQKADLGVFSAIAGILHSTGKFEGRLSAITVHGEASVPDFRLRRTGAPVPLVARFAATVDGTNGNTMLEPVAATLGSTSFTTSGGIIRHEANQPRAISLDLAMPNGDLRDILRLTMKGPPFMEGRLALNTKIDIPPLTGRVREKLELDGRFTVREGKFLHSTIQNQIEALSSRARGQAQDDREQVVSRMAGQFHLENAALQFRALSFAIPGADIDLAGSYNLDSDALDLGGTLKLQATVSQIVTGSQPAAGWKRVVLKTVDRFFEKDGAGTFLHIRVQGTSKAPKFAVILAGKQLPLPLPKR
jgi:AsmA-like C-terminal region